MTFFEAAQVIEEDLCGIFINFFLPFCTLEYFPLGGPSFVNEKSCWIFVFLFCHRYCPEIPLPRWLAAV